MQADQVNARSSATPCGRRKQTHRCGAADAGADQGDRRPPLVALRRLADAERGLAAEDQRVGDRLLRDGRRDLGGHRPGLDTARATLVPLLKEGPGGELRLWQGRWTRCSRLECHATKAGAMQEARHWWLCLCEAACWGWCCWASFVWVSRVVGW
jgi:hypothetical protein